MTNDSPMLQLMQFIQNELIGSTSEPISADDDLLGEGRIDSMGVMRLVAYLESEFGISVPPEDVTIEHFESPRTISRYIEASQTGGG